MSKQTGVDTFKIAALAKKIWADIESLAAHESSPEYQELTRQLMMSTICQGKISRKSALGLALGTEPDRVAA